MIQRLSKTACVAAMALFASLTAFGNITDYGANLPFVQHVLAMDTIFPDSAIHYRAIQPPWLQHAAYLAIILLESATALLCWLGAIALFRARKADARAFHRSKNMAIAGLTLGFLTWQVGFMSIGGEWFGMWMSETWNGIPSAFRFLCTLMLVLIYLAQKDGELNE
ncbi:DUF2165 family protein [Pollutimonas sp. M17]|uniref:DUF2165 family protein n=1 Tax=Pollutimonas sp. M17 TaxID=2962065 RepID=UPI0021F4447D|nr:DUF2165 domain-containing protein [Pollutimonas sp. M17]UYO94927.1 DUF2165 domain-containing protein [Pollutimonas sp. M17]